MGGGIMKRILFLGISLGVFLNSTDGLAAANSYPELAKEADAAVWNKLEACHLARWDAHDPRLPIPQVPAQDAVVSPRAGLLAYYADFFGGFAQTAVWKAPNGGQVHSITFNNQAISFSTPYGGVVARSSKYVTTGGAGYYFYCGSNQLANLNQFYQCIQANFVDVIANQLCRF